MTQDDDPLNVRASAQAEASPGLALTLQRRGRRALRIRVRRSIVITTLLGSLSALGVALAATPVDRTFATISTPAQSLMSITLPFLGVLLARDLRSSTARSVLPSIALAVLLAVIVALFGVIACLLSPRSSRRPQQAAAGSTVHLSRWAVYLSRCSVPLG